MAADPLEQEAHGGQHTVVQQLRTLLQRVDRKQARIVVVYQNDCRVSEQVWLGCKKSIALKKVKSLFVDISLLPKSYWPVGPVKLKSKDLRLHWRELFHT